MTKSILIKLFVGLLLANSLSCAKKSETRIAPKDVAVVDRADDAKPQPVDISTIKEPRTKDDDITKDPPFVANSTSGDDTVVGPIKVKLTSGDDTVASPVIVKLASNDNTVATPKVIKVASGDNTVVASAVKTTTKESRTKDDDITKELNTADKPATTVDEKNKNQPLKFTDIKVLDADMLNNVTSSDTRVLFENYITTDEKASKMIALRKYGMACRFSVSEKIIKSDILKFKTMSTATSLNANGDNRAKIQFASDKKTLDILCNFQGEISQAYFNDNFFDVIDFKNAKGKFSSDTVKKLTYEQIVEKTKSMKIVNAEKLLKADVNNEKQQEKFGIIAGELVEETKSILDVQLGRAKQACAVVGIKGELKNNKVFKLIGVRPGNENIENNYANMQIYYGNSTDKAELVIECTLRRNGVGPGIVFETFKGILEYGVLTKTPVKK